MSFTLFPGTRLALALDSLAGLSVGDALGGQHFAGPVDLGHPPPAPWAWTDDTEQACCLVTVLAEGDFDRDQFADRLGRHHDPGRGYGPGAVVLLRQIREGLPWPIAAAAAFDGQGSAGNGAAMRAAPLGAWHADSPARAAAQGARAAEVTHAHAEGIAGGVAVAVAAAAAAAGRLDGQRPSLLATVAAHTPPGRVRDGLVAARRFARSTAAEATEAEATQAAATEAEAQAAATEAEAQAAATEAAVAQAAVARAAAMRAAATRVAAAAAELGNGTRAMARDTVPFAVWVADRFLDDYPAAIAACLAAGGDVDTTCAIAGGIVTAYTGPAGIPPGWLRAREPLPAWLAAATGE